MSETLEGEVLFVVPPDELTEHNLTDEVRELAAEESRNVLVCRKGGRPSWPERIWSFLRRKPIKAVTIVTDQRAAAGDNVTMTVRETTLTEVYETIPQHENQ